MVSIVSAQGLADSFKVMDGSGQDPLDAVAGNAGYDVRAGGKTGAFDFISPVLSRIIQTAVSLLGVIFILLIIYGGYLWMSDQGNEEQVTKAKKIITAAVLGLIIVVSSYAISIFIVNAFAKKTIETPQQSRDFPSEAI